MSEGMTQEQERFWLYEVPHVLKAHLEMLAGIVGRLIGGEMRSVGYVTGVRGDDGITRDRLTNLGERALDNAARLAVDASEALYAMEGQSTGARDEKHRAILEELLYDGARAMSVVAAALLGARQYPDPHHVTWGCSQVIEELLGRAESEEVRKATEIVKQQEAGQRLAERRRERDAPASTPKLVPTPDDGEGSDMQDLHAAVHAAGKGLVSVGGGMLAADTGDLGMLALLRDRSMEAARLLWSIESETPYSAQPSGWKEMMSTLYSVGPLIMAVEHAMEDPDAVVCRGVSERWYVSAAAARDTGQAMIEWAEKHAAEEVVA